MLDKTYAPAEIEPRLYDGLGAQRRLRLPIRPQRGAVHYHDPAA